jgi:hypothetical protein
MTKSDEVSDRFTWKPGDIRWTSGQTSAQKLAASVRAVKAKSAATKAKGSKPKPPPFKTK